MSERLHIHKNRKSTTDSLVSNHSKLLDKNHKPLVSRPPLIQTKLTINQPGDEYEQEADRVAEEVMRMPLEGQSGMRMNSAFTDKIDTTEGLVQRKDESSDEEGDCSGWERDCESFCIEVAKQYWLEIGVTPPQRAEGHVECTEDKLPGNAAMCFLKYANGVRLSVARWSPGKSVKVWQWKPSPLPIQVLNASSDTTCTKEQNTLVLKKISCDSQTNTPSKEPQEESGPTSKIQRSSVHESSSPLASPMVHDVLNSPGQSLDPATCTFMEKRFLHDFSKVRVHTDTHAAQSAKAVAARAYTVGSHIVFAEGQFDTARLEGRRLLAHELAHIIQQSNAGLAQNTGSLLKTGLSLQRQQCSKANDEIVTDPLRTEMPSIKCEPTPVTLETVRSNAGINQEIFGLTRSIIGHHHIQYQELGASLCKATIREHESLRFNPFIYTKEGTYDYGTEIVPAGRPCPSGKQISRRLMITKLMAQKLRDGEAEHCEDHKLAFALSQSKFNQAIQDLEGEYCAVGRTGAKICEPEFAQRFKDRTGVDFSRRITIIQCLHDKTKLRDDPARGWHNIGIDYDNDDRFYAPDCSVVTYIPSHLKMTHINAHSSSTIVKGCGEPP